MLVSGAKCCRNLVSSGGSCESYSSQKQALASPCRWPWAPVGRPRALLSRWSTDTPFHLHCKYSCACLASLVSICSPLLFILCLGSRSPSRSAEGCVTLGARLTWWWLLVVHLGFLHLTEGNLASARTSAQLAKAFAACLCMVLKENSCSWFQRPFNPLICRH